MAFAEFMNGIVGRALRVVGGGAMILLGYFTGGGEGLGIAIAGAIPLATGLADVCALAPVLGVPWSGAKIRAQAAAQSELHGTETVPTSSGTSAPVN